MLRKVALAIFKFVVVVYAIAVAFYAVPVVLGSLDDGMRVTFDRADPATAHASSNGLSPAQRDKYYHLSQGSEILPWFLLTAVEVADPNIHQAVRRESDAFRSPARSVAQ